MDRDAQAEKELALWPQPLDLERLAEHEPQPPKFIVEDWMPCGYATLMAGHGGVGKSGIALYLAVCIASGRPFFGIKVQRRRVVYLSCEDREGVLHWRLTRICSHVGVDLAQLRGSLEVLDLVGKPTILWEKDQTGNALTAAYGALGRLMDKQTVLVIDGVSDTFGGNENARSEVKAFVNAMLAVIDPDDGAVLLVAHVNKPAAMATTTTEGYSGSTQWHNAVRARWYLFPEISEDEERREPTGDLILELQKSNLGRAHQSMRFHWDPEANLFVGREIIGATAADRAMQERVEREAVLKALIGCAASSITVPSATTGRRTAYHVLCERPEFPTSLKGGKAALRRFWRHIERLRQMKLIEEREHRRTNRHSTAVLVPSEKASADASNGE